MGLLRILLAICVFCGHSRPIGHLRWLGGELAVELFFVVSGFYMQLILSTRYTRELLGKAWVSQFYKARYCRLLPAYLMGCVLVICMCVISLALFQHLLPPIPVWNYVWALADTPGNLVFKAFLCFTNLTILFQDLTMFFASHNGEIYWSANFWDSERLLWTGLVIPQGWSLGIELGFYSIAPYLLRWRSRWLFIWAIIGLVLKVAVLSKFHLGDPWTFRFFPFELGYFLVGALAYRHRAKLDWIVPRKFGKYFVYLLAIGFTGCRVPMPLPTLFYPLALSCLIPFMFRVTTADKADRLIGELSYPFYIFHMFALRIAGAVERRWWQFGPSSEWTGLVLTLLLSVFALALEVRYVEPWRARFGENRARGRQEL